MTLCVKHLGRIILVPTVVLAFALALPAAQKKAGAVKGSITGSVTTDAGVPARLATAELIHVETGDSQSMKTDAYGKFKFKKLAAGAYQVRITYSGFETFESEEIRVESKKPISIDVQLVKSQAAPDSD